ncbi:hypothetical protein PHMEG_00032007 [Phytophthora megakarya]|uniref:Uncharacterized protein n=1 Tax=Phytophthora megakarya TaxID=4795 RepID=A0A225UWP7_9STRA|nr:hypothetical protein PHMEG_00032007 [Phytophthora megakarya]
MAGIGDEQDQGEDSGFFGRPRDGQDGDDTESEERHVEVQSEGERLEAETRNRGRGRTGTETEGPGGVRPRPSQREEEMTEQSRFSLARTAAGRGAARREMVNEVWTNEEKEKEDDKTVEIKAEIGAVKAEVPDTDVQSLKLDPQGIERFSKEEVSWKGAEDGTNYEKAAKEEPAQTSGGFIPRYSGSESRRSDRPEFSWSRSHSREIESFAGQQLVGGVASSKVVSGSSADKTDAYRSLYGVGGGKSMGTVGPPNKRLDKPRGTGVDRKGIRCQIYRLLHSATRWLTWRKSFAGQQLVGGVASSKVVSGSSADKTDAYRSLAGQATGNLSGHQGNSLSNLPSIAFSNTVAHVVKSLPQFFSDSATVEKTRLF